MAGVVLRSTDESPYGSVERAARRANQSVSEPIQLRSLYLHARTVRALARGAYYFDVRASRRAVSLLWFHTIVKSARSGRFVCACAAPPYVMAGVSLRHYG